ncbi:hypothetical protein Tco_0987415, partial [Tanacetum coccineum]
MSEDVVQGHGGDGGSDDPPPTHYIPTGCGVASLNRGAYARRPEPRVKEDHEDKGPRSDFQFEWDNKIPCPDGAEGDDLGKDWGQLQTQFDLKPHMQSQRWTYINVGMQQHLQKLYNTNKASLKATHWVINPEIGTHDVESIRKQHPENITLADWDAQLAFWNDSRNQARAAQNRQNRAKSTMESSATRDYPSLIDTFFVTHTIGGGLGSNTPSGVPYNEEAINAMARKGKQQGHLPDVGRVFPGRATNVLSLPPPQCTYNPTEVEKLKR